MFLKRWKTMLSRVWPVSKKQYKDSAAEMQKKLRTLGKELRSVDERLDAQSAAQREIMAALSGLRSRMEETENNVLAAQKRFHADLEERLRDGEAADADMLRGLQDGQKQLLEQMRAGETAGADALRGLDENQKQLLEQVRAGEKTGADALRGLEEGQKQLLEQVRAGEKTGADALRGLEEGQKRSERNQRQLIAASRSANAAIDRNLGRIDLSIWLSRPSYPENMAQIKERFWKSYPRAEGDVLLVQQGKMWLLHRLKSICDEIDAPFWLDGGSLVGALRHNGFIPWDDDVDVCMMRDDFERLRERLADGSDYKIKEAYFASVFCRGYRFMRRDISPNVFVDIFTFDRYCRTEDTLQHEWEKLVGYKKELGRKYVETASAFGVPQLNNQTLDDMPELKESLDRLLDAYVQKVICDEPSEWIAWGLENSFGNASGTAWKLPRIFHESDIFPLQERRFENETMYVPNDFSRHVYLLYGSDHLEMPKDMGLSKHMKFFFHTENDLEMLKQLIADEEKRGM